MYPHIKLGGMMAYVKKHGNPHSEVGNNIEDNIIGREDLYTAD